MASIDSHAHVASPQFDEDRPAIAARAAAAGVRWVEIGTDLQGSRRVIEIAAEFPSSIIGATVGVHPSDVGELTAEAWEELEQLMHHERVVAVGEVGLDFWHEPYDREAQVSALRQFVALAARQRVPLVFHVRSGKDHDAHAAMLDFLHSLPKEQRPRGVMHTFSGTWEQGEAYLALGLHLSISGVVTFKNAPDMQAVAERAPLERLLIETDCPFLAPEPYRGKRNEPAYVHYVGAKIADLRGISVEEVAAATEANTLALFGKN